MKILQTIRNNKLIAVIRGANKKNIIPIANALNRGGIKILEITSETPQSLSLVEKIRTEFNENEITVGLGTVLDSETARLGVYSGAQFIFSPTTNHNTIRTTKRYGAVSIPGAMTPTEILQAYESGADIIKVFPAGTLGVKYFGDLSAPLPHIPLMPTGGVNLNNIEGFLDSGAIAIGLGNSLVDLWNNIDDNYLYDIEEKALQFKRKIE